MLIGHYRDESGISYSFGKWDVSRFYCGLFFAVTDAAVISAAENDGS